MKWQYHYCHEFFLHVHNAETSVTFTHVEQQLKYNYDAEHDGVYSLQFSYDGSKLAIGYGDGSIEVSD